MKILGQLFKYTFLLLLTTCELMFELSLNITKALKQALDKR